MDWHNGSTLPINWRGATLAPPRSPNGWLGPFLDWPDSDTHVERVEKIGNQLWNLFLHPLKAALDDLGVERSPAASCLSDARLRRERWADGLRT
jgi:hypothetical protein